MDSLPKTPYLRGKVCMDMSRDCIRKLANNYGFNWSIQKGKLLLVPKEGLLNVINIVNNTTGLIGFPEIHIDGIHLKTLLNPNIIVGSVVQLDNAVINGRSTAGSVGLNSGVTTDSLTPTVDGAGKYRVISVTYSGDTRGQQWYNNIIGLAVDNYTGSTGGISSQGLLKRVGGITGNYQNADTK